MMPPRVMCKTVLLVMLCETDDTAQVLQIAQIEQQAFICWQALESHVH